jgi:hypothetical protein
MTAVREALAKVGTRFTRSLLEEVAGLIDEEKGRLLRQFMYGSITWLTELGRPDGSMLASGFVITHEAYCLEAVATPDGIDIRKGFYEVSDVNSQDAESPTGQHRVAFLAHWHALAPNRISVEQTR